MHMLEQHQGKDHVSAQDQADENMAGSGSGVYLAEYKGEYMEVSMESANQLTVSAGALWVNGRFCIVDPAETLTVDNGSSGMTEYDLVCVHWKETTATQQVALAEGGTKEVSTTVEETELVIVKGDPASSGATDPEISQTTIRAGVGEAWVPFARITKDGLTPSVAFIVDKLVPESKFRDSISQPIKTEQIEEGCTLYYYPDNTVEISVYDMLMSGVNTWILGTLDKSPRHKACMALCASDADHTGTLWVNDNGQVVCKHNITGSYHYNGNMRIPLS